MIVLRLKENQKVYNIQDYNLEISIRTCLLLSYSKIGWLNFGGNMWWSAKDWPVIVTPLITILSVKLALFLVTISLLELGHKLYVLVSSEKIAVVIFIVWPEWFLVSWKSRMCFGSFQRIHWNKYSESIWWIKSLWHINKFKTYKNIL